MSPNENPIDIKKRSIFKNIKEVLELEYTLEYIDSNQDILELRSKSNKFEVRYIVWESPEIFTNVTSFNYYINSINNPKVNIANPKALFRIPYFMGFNWAEFNSFIKVDKDSLKEYPINFFNEFPVNYNIYGLIRISRYLQFLYDRYPISGSPNNFHNYVKYFREQFIKREYIWWKVIPKEFVKCSISKAYHEIIQELEKELQSNES
jgi:hypothetical protein